MLYVSLFTKNIDVFHITALLMLFQQKKIHDLLTTVNVSCVFTYTVIARLFMTVQDHKHILSNSIL